VNDRFRLRESYGFPTTPQRIEVMPVGGFQGGHNKVMQRLG